MKKIVYIFAVLLFVSVKAAAQNPQLIIDDCYAPIGGQVVVAVKYDTEGENYSGVNFNIDLPEGLTFVLDASKNIKATMDASNSGFQAVTSPNGFAPFSTSDYLAGKNGILLTFIINVASDLTKDEKLECTVRNLAFTSAAGTKISLEPFSFVVTISDKWVLDENSAAVPASTDGIVDVLVKRTIPANQWSTICLPFEMDEEQVKAAFGDGVQIAEFVAATFAEDAIEIEFENANLSRYGFEANMPYVIKVPSPLSEFEVSAKIEPNESKAVATVRRAGDFIGTLHAGSKVPENSLFISGNKFWYSKGNTTIKSFRGYFTLEKSLMNAKISLIVNGESTSIDGMNVQYAVEGVYDLSGRKIQLENGDLNKLQKGVYIIDGKKVTIK